MLRSQISYSSRQCEELEMTHVLDQYMLRSQISYSSRHCEELEMTHALDQN